MKSTFAAPAMLLIAVASLISLHQSIYAEAPLAPPSSAAVTYHQAPVPPEASQELAVDGLSLGMTQAEVESLLGPPVSATTRTTGSNVKVIQRSYPAGCTSDFWAEPGQPEFLFRVSGGTLSQAGRPLLTLGDSSRQVTDLFGAGAQNGWFAVPARTIGAQQQGLLRLAVDRNHLQRIDLQYGLVTTMTAAP